MAVGLIDVVIVENVVVRNLQLTDVDTLHQAGKGFLGVNVQALIQHLQQGPAVSGAAPPIVGPGQAVLVVCAYAAVLVAASAALFLRRDVT